MEQSEISLHLVLSVLGPCLDHGRNVDTKTYTGHDGLRGHQSLVELADLVMARLSLGQLLQGPQGLLQVDLQPLGWPWKNWRLLIARCLRFRLGELGCNGFGDDP